MKQNIITLAGLVLLLIVGFSFACMVTGDFGSEDGEPFTAAIMRSISSFFGGAEDTEETVKEVDASGSTVHEVGAFQPDDPNYYGPELHAAKRPLPAEAVEKTLIMNRSIDFVYTARSFEVDIEDGPLVITYYINDHDDTTINCFMELTVTDCTTGEVLLEDGYRRKYSADLKKDLTLFYEGPVRIDLYGNKVNADIFIYADR